MSICPPVHLSIHLFISSFLHLFMFSFFHVFIISCLHVSMFSSFLLFVISYFHPYFNLSVHIFTCSPVYLIIKSCWYVCHLICQKWWSIQNGIMNIKFWISSVTVSRISWKYHPKPKVALILGHPVCMYVCGCFYMHVTYINRNAEGTSHFVKETNCARLD